jgi:hypothetical protein
VADLLSKESYELVKGLLFQKKVLNYNRTKQVYMTGEEERTNE